MTDVSSSNNIMNAFSKGMGGISKEFGEYAESLKDNPDSPVLQILEDILGNGYSSIKDVKDLEKLSAVELVEIYQDLDEENTILHEEFYGPGPIKSKVGFISGLEKPMKIIEKAILEKVKQSKKDGEIDYSSVDIAEEGEDTQILKDWLGERDKKIFRQGTLAQGNVIYDL